MKKYTRIFAFVMIFAFLAGMTACGEFKLENWPTDKFVRGVPAAQAGVVEKSMVSSDTVGNKYAIITLTDFTADNMSEYISYILDSGWVTCSAQKNTNGIITYSARNKNGNKTMHLVCNTSKCELSIEIQ